jgi:hypothetical protein
MIADHLAEIGGLREDVTVPTPGNASSSPIPAAEYQAC